MTPPFLHYDQRDDYSVASLRCDGRFGVDVQCDVQSSFFLLHRHEIEFRALELRMTFFHIEIPELK